MTTEKFKPIPAVMIPLGQEYTEVVLEEPFIFTIQEGLNIEVGKTNNFRLETTDGQRVCFKAMCIAIDGDQATFDKVLD